jgi:hypothetical protein
MNIESIEVDLMQARQRFYAAPDGNCRIFRRIDKDASRRKNLKSSETRVSGSHGNSHFQGKPSLAAFGAASYDAYRLMSPKLIDQPGWLVGYGLDI